MNGPTMTTSACAFLNSDRSAPKTLPGPSARQRTDGIGDLLRGDIRLHVTFFRQKPGELRRRCLGKPSGSFPRICECASSAPLLKQSCTQAISTRGAVQNSKLASGRLEFHSEIY